MRLASRAFAAVVALGVVSAPQVQLRASESGAGLDSRSTASASGSEEKDSPFDLEYRIWGESEDRSLFSEASPSRKTPSTSLHQRLRLSYDQSFGQVRGVLEADFLAGRLAGDRAAPGTPGIEPGTRSTGRPWDVSENVVEPREAYLEYRSESIGQFTLGLQTSDWGLGLLANGGESSTDALFNRNIGGDRSFRALFGTKPLLLVADSNFANNFITAVGGDLVYRDENAALREGDLAGQAVFAFLYETETTAAGTYMTYRRQEDRDGDFLEALALDYYGEHRWEPDSGWHYRLGAEAVFLAGETDRTLVEPDGGPTALTAWGGVGEVEIGYRPAEVEFHLDGGFASGDGQLEDDTLTRFRFDPNYDVGLVLYDHYIPSATRASYRRLSDPVRSGESPKGAGGFVNGGSVENSVYLNPQLFVGPREGLSTGLGVLRAWSAEPFLDPFRTFENGGHPVGPTGRRPASHDLGWEVDLAARYRKTVDPGLTFELKTEYGVLFPGDAFRQRGAAEPPPQSAMRARLQVEW